MEESGREAGFGLLPNEVVMHVLSFLDFRELKQVSRSSKHLRALVRALPPRLHLKVLLTNKESKHLHTGSLLPLVSSSSSLTVEVFSLPPYCTAEVLLQRAMRHYVNSKKRMKQQQEEEASLLAEKEKERDLADGDEEGGSGGSSCWSRRKEWGLLQRLKPQKGGGYSTARWLCLHRTLSEHNLCSGDELIFKRKQVLQKVKVEGSSKPITVYLDETASLGGIQRYLCVPLHLECFRLRLGPAKNDGWPPTTEWLSQRLTLYEHGFETEDTLLFAQDYFLQTGNSAAGLDGACAHPSAAVRSSAVTTTRHPTTTFHSRQPFSSSSSSSSGSSSPSPQYRRPQLELQHQHLTYLRVQHAVVSALPCDASPSSSIQNQDTLIIPNGLSRSQAMGFAALQAIIEHQLEASPTVIRRYLPSHFVEEDKGGRALIDEVIEHARALRSCLNANSAEVEYISRYALLIRQRQQQQQQQHMEDENH
ncbi:hypothetical protein QOT17_000217 [Balamuthia mandrillaris]